MYRTLFNLNKNVGRNFVNSLLQIWWITTISNSKKISFLLLKISLKNVDLSFIRLSIKPNLSNFPSTFSKFLRKFLSSQKWKIPTKLRLNRQELTMISKNNNLSIKCSEGRESKSNPQAKMTSLSTMPFSRTLKEPLIKEAV